jgi:hypothetical protein
MEPVFNIGGVDIACETEVELYGVTIDFRLTFDKHILESCKKASRQLNALNRIG